MSEPLTLWQKIRRGILITLASITTIWGAIHVLQPPTVPAPIPVMQVASRLWVSTNDYTTSVTVSGVVYTVTIKTGFFTDYASIPTKLQAEYLLGMSNDTPCLRRAAYIHDGLYSMTDKEGEGGPVSLHIANLIFRQAMKEDGALPVKYEVCYDMVEAWGPFSVMRHTPDSIKQARAMVSVTVARTP